MKKGGVIFYACLQSDKMMGLSISMVPGAFFEKGGDECGIVSSE
jgi:hypothetical protein